MYILYPDKYLLPTYRISPFRTPDMIQNHNLPDSDSVDDYFEDRFKGSFYDYTFSGREALNIALGLINPDRNDVVTIFTTSGNKYISSCVTVEIEKFCKWSRAIIPETKVLLVNHEFGYPFTNLRKLREMNLPIIEDCAGSFFSEDNELTIGRTGDFVIYSFPKMFPIQIGGLLVSPVVNNRILYGGMHPDLLRYIKNVLSKYIPLKDHILKKRIDNYQSLRSKFEALGLPERFELLDNIIPGVFMFRTDHYDIDLPELKKHFWAHGIQSSVFYGEKAFFIPVHQALTDYDLDYFYEVMKSFIQNQVR